MCLLTQGHGSDCFGATLSNAMKYSKSDIREIMSPSEGGLISGYIMSLKDSDDLLLVQ